MWIGIIRPMKVLEGKVAVITGVGRKGGIGYAIAEKLGSMGAQVFATYLKAYDRELGYKGAEESPQELIEALKASGITAHFFEKDLREAGAASSIFDEVERVFLGADILINNACVSRNQPFLEVTPLSLEDHYIVNVKVPFFLCQEFVRRFKKETGGKIVNMTSGQSISMMPEELPYTTTKAGLEMMTVQLSHELREHGITINAVDPGPTDTGWMTDDIRNAILNDARGVIRTPKEVADAVATFVSGEREAQSGMVLHLQEIPLTL
jgi:3-oxoacyl-[acyl-carrier protein] reductase